MDSTKSTDWILENIVKIRKLKNKQGPEMAKALGIAQGTYSKLENGKIKDYYEYLPKIAQILGVSFHELVSPNRLNDFKKPLEVNANNLDSISNSNNSVPEIVIQQFEVIINVLKELNENLKSERDNYKRKYENCKVKLILAEGKNK
ncbi:MAG: helix-turn-helix transcriptional regulator [Bacteroidota bacterium]|nr:helix-turn-helix transcriptional regulator [Bacteroidota bacterium]